MEHNGNKELVLTALKKVAVELREGAIQKPIYLPIVMPKMIQFTKLDAKEIRVIMKQLAYNGEISVQKVQHLGTEIILGNKLDCAVRRMYQELRAERTRQMKRKAPIHTSTSMSDVIASSGRTFELPKSEYRSHSSVSELFEIARMERKYLPSEEWKKLRASGAI